MRFKKGFTLAEILIVLMVIGAIAAMTLPSLMRGVTEAQWKTAYKKAYNTVSNLAVMERIAGQLPSTANSVGVLKMFESLNSNLTVKDYADGTAIADIATGTATLNADAFKPLVKFTDASGNEVNSDATDAVTYQSSDAEYSPWITSEDNISYQVIKGTAEGGSCGTKNDIVAAVKTADAAKASCVLVVVDVNGLSKGPNKLEPQINADDLTGSMLPLTGDRYYIFVGLDGASAGSKAKTVSGRIMGDLK